MKLLFDENLSHRLISLLADIYPGSVHVRDVELQSAPDEEIWDYAARNHLTIISKDNDFHQRSFLSGHPPKVGLDCARQLLNRRYSGGLVPSACGPGGPLSKIPAPHSSL